MIYGLSKANNVDGSHEEALSSRGDTRVSYLQVCMCGKAILKFAIYMDIYIYICDLAGLGPI